MKSFYAFLKKEWLETLRSGKLTVLILLFILFGIMNPAIAKLTPWLLQAMSASLEESGFIVTDVQVDAMTSWTQFLKNIPMALMAFVLICSNLFSKEYQSGTLVLILTKGLARYKVVLAKAFLMCLLWSVCYWLCAGITYGYNAYFWDNGIASHLWLALICWWLFGMWVISLLVLFSVVCSSNTVALLGTAVVAGSAYVAGIFPKTATYTPAMLMDGASLLSGMAEPETYGKAILITIVSALVWMGLSIPVMNRKQI